MSRKIDFLNTSMEVKSLNKPFSYDDVNKKTLTEKKLDKSLTDAKSDYLMKENTYKMLLNTVKDSIDRGVNQSTINNLMSEVNDAYKNMLEAEKTYDSMQTAEDEAMEYLYYNEPESVDTTASTIDTNRNRYVDDIMKTIDKRCASNEFIVDFGSWGDYIPSYFVRSVDYVDNNTISLCLYDTVVKDIDGKEKPLVYFIENRVPPISMSIKHIDKQGEPIYTELFADLKLKVVGRTSLSYDIDEFSFVYVNVTFGKVGYEGGK